MNANAGCKGLLNNGGQKNMEKKKNRNNQIWTQASKVTLTSPLESNPSNWLRSSNIVLWISRSPPELDSYLERAIVRDDAKYFGTMPLKHSKPLFSGLQKQNKQTN